MDKSTTSSKQVQDFIRVLFRSCATSLPHSPRHLPEGNLVCIYTVLLLPSMKCIRALLSVCLSFFVKSQLVGVGACVERDKSAPAQTALQQQAGFGSD